MRPTLACLSKASRRPLTPKRGNKDYYKGTRQSSLPGLRTGAPGKYFGASKAQYRLVDEQVRVFVAPLVAELNCTPLKPYVPFGTHLTDEQLSKQPFGKLPKGGLSGEVYLEHVRQLEKQQNQFTMDSQGHVIP